MKEKYKLEFKILGELIKQVREEKEISIDEVASLTRIRRDYLKKIEKGEAYGMRTSHFVLIAEALRIPAQELAKKFDERL